MFHVSLKNNNFLQYLIHISTSIHKLELDGLDLYDSFFGNHVSVHKNMEGSAFWEVTILDPDQLGKN